MIVLIQDVSITFVIKEIKDISKLPLKQSMVLLNALLLVGITKKFLFKDDNYIWWRYCWSWDDIFVDDVSGNNIVDGLMVMLVSLLLIKLMLMVLIMLLGFLVVCDVIEVDAVDVDDVYYDYVFIKIVVVDDDFVHRTNEMKET